MKTETWTAAAGSLLLALSVTAPSLATSDALRSAERRVATEQRQVDVARQKLAQEERELADAQAALAKLRQPQPTASPTSSKPVPPSTTAPAPTPAPTKVTVPITPPTTPGGEYLIPTAYTTGYTWYDNTPPGSSIISNPILHQRAGGVGTFEDPATMAVGHDLHTGKDVLDFPAGTKLYLPDVRRYFIVEDTCGDGPKPETIPCHQGFNADGSGSTVWFDLWIGGEGGARDDVQACAGIVTDKSGQLHTVVVNPRPGYVVAPGNAVFHDNRCDAGYGNDLLRVG